MNLKSSKKDIKTNRGITLIALVITIIVLLILAGVAIATLTGDNGILTKAGDARNTTQEAEIEEEIRVAWNKVYMDSYLDSNTNKATALQAELKGSVVTPNGDFLDITYKGKTLSINATTGAIKQPLPVITAGQKAPATSNAQYKSGNYTAIIPAGFTVSATESSIENGLVVTDGTTNQNEWVWIPVSSSDLAKMYTEDTTGWNMLGTSVNTKLKTKELTTQNTFKLGSRELPRTNPGTTADPYYREPDVLSSYDINPTYLDQAGFKNIEDMATKLKDDYKDMIDSVRENGGFYIGRYEIGKNTSDNNKPQVKAGAVMNTTNWYNLYSACKSFSSGKVEARMIWGCQWDQVCRFISTLGDNKVSSLDNSTSYGNYSGSTDYKTGTRNNCITNNIHDLAGNCWEWTQEAYDTYCRASRGRR